MYAVQAQPCHFTHSIRIDSLPTRFQEFLHDWTRHMPSEKLYYYDGTFYMSVPFEMLLADTTTKEELTAFTRRFNRLHDVGNHESLAKHVESYPYKNWVSHGETIENYLEMIYFLHHLKTKIPPELSKPSTLAIFVHD